RREQRIQLVAEIREQALTTVLDVVALRGERPRAAEFGAWNALFVVRVSEPVLMEADEPRHARAGRQLCGELRRNSCRNHGGVEGGLGRNSCRNQGNVERRACFCEERRETEQAIVCPPRLVVTEKQREGDRARVERARDQPGPAGNHGAGLHERLAKGRRSNSAAMTRRARGIVAVCVMYSSGCGGRPSGSTEALMR